jgi:hypothetical protein
MEELKCIQDFVRQHEGKRPLEDLGMNGRIILKQMLRD